MIAVQFILLTVAWTHACIGLYFWLRMKPFFRWAAPILLSIAVLLPPLAMLGAHQGAQEVIRRAKDPAWRAQNIKPIPPDKRQVIDNITLFYFPIGYAAAILLVFAARGVRTLNERRRGMVTVSYPGRQVRIPKGLSVLEASLRNKVPHASVCGGRARCSTCRVKVVSDRSALPKPSGRTLVFGVIFLALILFLQYLQSPVNKSKEINYTQFVESVEKGDVKTATFQYEGQTYNVTGELREKDTTYETVVPAVDTELTDLYTQLRSQNVKMDFKAAETNGGWIALLTTIVPFIIIFILFFFLINQAQAAAAVAV